MKQDNASYKTGVEFAPGVDVEFNKVNDSQDGRRKLWFCCVCIGEEYYETDSYTKKENAISEMLGYLEFVSLNIQTEIDNLKEMLK